MQNLCDTVQRENMLQADKTFKWCFSNRAPMAAGAIRAPLQSCPHWGKCVCACLYFILDVVSQSLHRKWDYRISVSRRYDIVSVRNIFQNRPISKQGKVIPSRAAAAPPRPTILKRRSANTLPERKTRERKRHFAHLSESPLFASQAKFSKDRDTALLISALFVVAVTVLVTYVVKPLEVDCFDEVFDKVSNDHSTLLQNS